jgi:histone acetyltransferase
LNIGSASADANKQRQSNLQRIQQRKQSLRCWPLDKKLEKLAIYSSCKADGDCKCNGWKNPNPPPNPPRPDAPNPTASPSDPCRTCNHTLSDHVTHLQHPSVTGSELDRLLGIVVDVENLFMCVHKEEDGDTKQVYFYLFKLLRKSILQVSTPTIDGPLGSPPFEKPSIAKGIQNFVNYKFSHLPQKDWQTMYDLSKLFLHCLNYWKLETPTSRKQTMSAEDISSYKMNYTRWLCYCHVPAFCDSLPHYEITLIFGQALLKSVFQTMRKTMLGKFRAEKDKMPQEKKTLVLTHLPRFLSLLEEEIYAPSSPIWDPDFKQTAVPHLGAKSAVLAAAAAASGSSDSDSLSSRKRSLMTDDESGNGSKRQRLVGVDEEDFDQAIAEIVAVIDDESKMLGMIYYLF